jgi:SpoIID/LytB domain protein
MAETGYTLPVWVAAAARSALGQLLGEPFADVVQLQLDPEVVDWLVEGVGAAERPLLRPVPVEAAALLAPGRALALAFQGSKGQLVLRRDAIRRSLRQLPSTLFSVAPAAPGVWRFEGGGFGHGAGLSQAGAMDLARRGWSLQKILSHYYPGTTLEPWGSLSKGL